MKWVFRTTNDLKIQTNERTDDGKIIKQSGHIKLNNNFLCSFYIVYHKNGQKSLHGMLLVSHNGLVTISIYSPEIL